MKIAYLIPNCSVSGGVAVVCQHVNRLKNLGHSVFLLATSEIRPMDWFPGQEVPVIEASSWDGDLDIVVATGWSTSFWLPFIEAKVKCYFVQSDETRFHPNGSRWQHLTTLSYYFGVHYFTEARWIRDWLKENFGHDAELIPNGLDPKIFYPCDPIEPRGATPRILLEGAIGIPYKGMKEAFEAVQEVDAEVWCVSSYGKPHPNWKCDRFFEEVPMLDMKGIYSSCDILLKLSQVEGFFGPPMEMMACGGAVVVGCVTGYDEYIVDEVNALVVNADDNQAARNAVQRLINDVNLRNKLIQGGRQTASEWSWDPSITKLEKYFAQLIANPILWYNNSNRAQYDLSISYAFGQLSKGILPEEIGAISVSKPIPPHVQTLAAHIAGSYIFIKFADVVRFFVHKLKKIRGF